MSDATTKGGRREAQEKETHALTYLSLGAGVQSTALYWMSCWGLHGVPIADLAALFEYGALEASTDSAAFLDRVAAEVRRLRAALVEEQDTADLFRKALENIRGCCHSTSREAHIAGRALDKS